MTAAIVGAWWVVLLGVIGYLLALLVDVIGGGSLGRTRAVRLARAEQENRELRAEQTRLLGALRDREARPGQASGAAENSPVQPAARGPETTPRVDTSDSSGI